MDPEAIKDAINQTMPFGKYAGRRLFHLPETYLVWFNKQGFPEVKLNGLESVVEPLLHED